MKYPTVGMKKAFDKMNEYKLTFIRYYTNHTLEHRTSFITGLETWEYAHYNTWVGSVIIDKMENKKIVKLSPLGFSATDRDNFNGLLSLLNINSVRVSLHDGTLYLKHNGNIIKEKEVII